ncbi:hypothetical protein [Catellatospora sp. NPDC049609]|uniref:hypothetical protein n=1 Tax=Catellatospora sp. NPDC049609 TaxID=3155505 RepID=UPI00341A430C
MTVLPTAAEYTARLTAIDWTEGGFTRTRSRHRLMAEHLRRTAWWARQLDCAEWPFPDLAACADPTVRADPALVTQIERLLALAPDPVLEAAVNGLHWYTLRDHAAVPLPDLADPYEPLLLFFERGGGFTLITGYIDIHSAYVERGDLHHHLTTDACVELDADILDALDRP